MQKKILFPGLALRWFPCCLLLVCLVLPCSVVTTALAGAEATQTNLNQRTVMVVVGAPGEEEFAEEFASWAERWKASAEKGGLRFVQIGSATATNQVSGTTPAPVPVLTDRQRIEQALAAEPKEGDELWLVLMGHGTFNGREAKFNLNGPDLSATNLVEWLQPFRRPMAIVAGSSSSAPFLKALTATNRVVITATRSGYEQSYARFGKYLSEAVGEQGADLDKDGQTSLLEAFIMASKQAESFYKSEGRLATEHALIDDTGDGFGTQADWFRGARATKKPSQGSSVDGLLANRFHLLRSAEEQKLPAEVRARRDELEQAVNTLRESKAEMPAEDYYQRLEKLLLELARVYFSEAR